MLIKWHYQAGAYSPADKARLLLKAMCNRLASKAARPWSKSEEKHGVSDRDEVFVEFALIRMDIRDVRHLNQDHVQKVWAQLTLAQRFTLWPA